MQTEQTQVVAAVVAFAEYLCADGTAVEAAERLRRAAADGAVARRAAAAAAREERRAEKAERRAARERGELDAGDGASDLEDDSEDEGNLVQEVEDAEASMLGCLSLSKLMKDYVEQHEATPQGDALSAMVSNTFDVYSSGAWMQTQVLLLGSDRVVVSTFWNPCLCDWLSVVDVCLYVACRYCSGLGSCLLGHCLCAVVTWQEPTYSAFVVRRLERFGAQGEMETSLINTDRKVKAELDRRKQIARELARLEIRELFGRKVADAKGVVEKLQKQMRELEACVRRPAGGAEKPLLGARLSAAVGSRRLAQGRADSGGKELEDALGSLQFPPGRVPRWRSIPGWSVGCLWILYQRWSHRACMEGGPSCHRCAGDMRLFIVRPVPLSGRCERWR